MKGLDRDCWAPEHVRTWLRGLGLSLPLEDMEPHARAWDGRVGLVGRCGVERGARAAIRRADGGAAHVGRGGRDRVRVRDAGVLEGARDRPGAAAPEGRGRRDLLTR